MKKFSLAFMVPAMALLAACGSDDEPAKPINIDAQDVAVLTLNASTGDYNHACEARCAFSVNENEQTANINITGAVFDSHMPHGVNFIIGGVRVTSITRHGDECSFNLTASTATMTNPSTSEEYDGYQITNVNGHVDTARDIYVVNFNVTTRGSSFKVMLTGDEVRTIISGNDYETSNDLFYEYHLDLDNLKAGIYIHNVQFSVGGASSPVLPKIHIPDLTVTPTATGYKLTGNGIIPNNITAGGPVPMGERFMVTNFEANLNVLTGAHDIYFNCMGGEHSGNARLAL